MKGLRFYSLLSRMYVLNLRQKVIVLAGILPWLAYGILGVIASWQGAVFQADALVMGGIPLVSMISFATVCALVALLRPVEMTAAALRHYGTTRGLPDLPTHYLDDLGVMMSDTQTTIVQLEGALQHLERFDPVTGVLNRTGLAAHLRGQSVNDATLIALRLTNGDDAKNICDATQYDQMHVVLVKRMAAQFGASLRARVSEYDYIIIFSATSDEPLETKVFRLRAALDAMAVEIGLGQNRFTPEIVAGCAPLELDVTASIDSALAAARRATLSHPIAIHSDETQGRMRDDFVLEQDLRQALRNDELMLHFQPVMDMKLNKPVGAEALIRWNSPKRGMVPPNAFIPLAEASGLIEPIGLWVLRNACASLAEWGPEKSVAINLGARQFMDPNLDKHVAGAIANAGIRGDQLEIELTETVATVDHAYTLRTFYKLRDMGVRIAIDDFGTGYASMSMLHKLPFHKLKIDREFVTNVDHARDCQAICSALLTLGHGLGIDVLAEGTETSAEVNYLSSRGCSLFQGYYFSRPVPANDLPNAFAALAQRKAG